MKLTAILTIICFLQASANGFSQKITLSEENASLEHILKQIQKQTGADFFYSTPLISTAKRISINVQDAPLVEVLTKCFAGQPIQFSIYDKAIVLRPRVIPATPPTPVFEDKLPIDVSGKVVDEKGEMVVGATILVKGTGKAVTTDGNGAFTLLGIEEKVILEISGINIETQTVALNGRREVTVYVKTSIKELNETVIIGFGTEKKVNLTGAVSQVSGKVLVDRPVTNIGQALQGVVPNLNITTGGDPGGPGTDASFNIRGNTTLTKGSGNPLFIIDGMPVDQPNDLNPNDISSVSVLKDAAASAIYGARAPYGVILITTKKGKKGSKPVVTYNNMFGTSSYTRLPQMVNSYDFAHAFNIASENSGQGSPFSEETIEQIKANIEKPGSYPVSRPDPNNSLRWTYADPTNTDNVDWFKVYFKPWSFNQKHDLSMSGGGNNTTYYLGAGFLDQDGQLRYGKEKFQRYNFTGNIGVEPTKWLRLNFRTRFARRATDIPYEYANQVGNWIHMATTRHPNWALRDPNGLFSVAGNVDLMANGGRRKKSEDDLTLIGSAEIEPIKGWKTNFDYSYNNQTSKNTGHNAYVWSYGPQNNKFKMGPTLNSISQEMITDLYQSINIYSSYEKNFHKHYMKILAGHQYEKYNGLMVGGDRSDLITDDIPSISTSTGTQIIDDNIPYWATMGFFGRLNYNFDEKFLFEVNGRYDGSSKFPKSRRFGFFPSVSAGYNISMEKFWFPLKKYVNDLKIRGSYGSLGNQNVTDYLYLATMEISRNIPYAINGVRPSSLRAPGIISADLTWEKSRTFDLGFDATFLGSRLELTYDWFTRNTIDMFGPASVLPSTLGASVPFQNNADLQTTGFDLSLRWRDKIGADFHYNIGIVLSDYRSTIKKYYNPQKLLPLDTRNNNVYYEGMTMGEIWGMETLGLIQDDADIAAMSDQSDFSGTWTPGDVMYKDLDGDKKITWGNTTLANHGDLKVIGNSTPRYSYGATFGFSWKGLDFTMFWQGVAKRKIWLGGDGWGNDGNIFWGFVRGFGNNIYKTTLDFWTSQNTDAYYPKPYLSDEIVKNHRPQSRYLQNAAYARLKNLQIGYNLAPLLNKAGINRLRVFMSGENLITLTKLHKNYDPELLGGGWGTGKVYPLLKTFSAGLNLGF